MKASFFLHSIPDSFLNKIKLEPFRTGLLNKKHLLKFTNIQTGPVSGNLSLKKYFIYISKNTYLSMRKKRGLKIISGKASNLY